MREEKNRREGRCGGGQACVRKTKGEEGERGVGEIRLRLSREFAMDGRRFRWRLVRLESAAVVGRRLLGEEVWGGGGGRKGGGEGGVLSLVTLSASLSPVEGG